MKIIADYHTHTIFSHGRGTVEDNVHAAIKKGLQEIAITDHGLRHVVFGLRRRKLALLREQIDALNARFMGKIRVLMGVEANLIGLDGTIDLPKEFMAHFDILLVGYHRMAWLKDLKTFWHFAVKNLLYKKGKKYGKIVQKNTQAYVRSMEKYPIACITHPNDMIHLDMDMLGKAAARTGTALELNIRHNSLTVEEIGRLKENGAPFMISSDAHRSDDVGDLAGTVRLADDAGLKESDVLNAKGCGRSVRKITPVE
ncbi:MAG: PHP domain-containing protein [Bacillota bacterium]